MFAAAREVTSIRNAKKEIMHELRDKIKRDKSMIRNAKKIKSRTDLEIFYDTAEYIIEK